MGQAFVATLGGIVSIAAFGAFVWWYWWPQPWWWPESEAESKETVSVARAASEFPAHSVDYNEEMEAFIFEPCLIYIRERIEQRRGPVSEQKWRSVRNMMGPSLAYIRNQIIPLLEGRSFDERVHLYEIGLLSCIDGVDRGAEHRWGDIP